MRLLIKVKNQEIYVTGDKGNYHLTHDLARATVFSIQMEADIVMRLVKLKNPNVELETLNRESTPAHAQYIAENYYTILRIKKDGNHEYLYEKGKESPEYEWSSQLFGAVLYERTHAEKVALSLKDQGAIPVNLQDIIQKNKIPLKEKLFLLYSKKENRFAIPHIMNKDIVLVTTKEESYLNMTFLEYTIIHCIYEACNNLILREYVPISVALFDTEPVIVYLDEPYGRMYLEKMKYDVSAKAGITFSWNSKRDSAMKFQNKTQFIDTVDLKIKDEYVYTVSDFKFEIA